MLPYRWKVRLLKSPRVNYWWRYWRARGGACVGAYHQLPAYIREHAPGRTFADIGCMWGVNGAYAFAAEEAGATAVTAVDVFGPTPEFEERRLAGESKVRFVLGDITAPATIAAVGTADVVFCAGVLYHHPSPFDLLVALRRVCGETLILRTSTIPEMRHLPNAAIFYPLLDSRARQLWNLQGLGVPSQAGITDAFRPEQGYGNWFWGITPSCLRSMVQCAGFDILQQAEEPFAQTILARAVATPFGHRLPGEDEARELGASVSASGAAQPA